MGKRVTYTTTVRVNNKLRTPYNLESLDLLDGKAFFLHKGKNVLKTVRPPSVHVDGSKGGGGKKRRPKKRRRKK